MDELSETLKLLVSRYGFDMVIDELEEIFIEDAIKPNYKPCWT